MKLLTQLALILGLCLVGEGLAVLLPIPIPASVLSLLLILLLLLVGWLRLPQLEEVSDFLLKNMPLFFIPAGVGILENLPIIQKNLIPLFLICLLTTIFTFGATALTVRGVIRLQQRRGSR